MKKAQWVARPYRYADNVPWNDGRYEIFFWQGNGWAPVGGVIKRWDGQTIAFLCTKTQQRTIRTPAQASSETGGLHSWGVTMKEALQTLRSMYPDPTEVLRQRERALASTF